EASHEHVRPERHQFTGHRWIALGSIGIACFNDDVLIFDPAIAAEPLRKGLLEFPRRWISGHRTERSLGKQTNPVLCRLLCLGGERRGEETARKRAEEHPARRHWITSSARCSSDGGIVRPSAFAVLRLITSSNLVGCSTGRSAGLAPFTILSP